MSLKLAKELESQGKIEQAIQQCDKVIKVKSDNFHAWILMAKCYENLGSLDEAATCIRRAIQLKPSNDKLYVNLARLLKKQETIEIDDLVNVYQKAIEIQPQQTLEIYNNLFDIYYQAGNLDAAISTYQQAITLYSNRFDIYFKLIQVQTEKKDFDAVIISYQKAVNQNLTWKSKFVKIFQKSQEIYLYIWKKLNEINLKTIDEFQSFPFTQISLVKSHKYFKSTSNYRVITLNNIVQEDESLLRSNKICLESLKSILFDTVKQQLKYLEYFACDKKLSPANLVKISDSLVFQESMVETGCIYSVCPINGKILKSNQSFLLNGQLIIYRFIGQEIFYLLAYGPAFRKHSIYFPKFELIVCVDTLLDYVSIFNRWKALAVTYWNKVISNLVDNNRKETILIHGWMESTAHYLLNELPGIQRLHSTERLDKIDKVLIGRYEYYGKLEKIFPEISPDKIVRISDKDLNSLSEVALDNKYFALKVGNTFIQEDLARRVSTVALDSCSPDFLELISCAKQQHFPLIWITIRTGRRVWISQVEGLAKILQKLSVSFPKLGVVFDGISRPYRDEMLLSNREELMLDKDLNVASQIINILQDSNISVYNSIGCRMYEGIVWANAIDFYIVPFGGGMAKITYIANKPGIVHTNHTVLESFKHQWYNSSQRENGRMPVYIPAHHIVDLPESSTNSLNNSYDCDWQVIYDEAIKMICNVAISQQ